MSTINKHIFEQRCPHLGSGGRTNDSVSYDSVTRIQDKERNAAKWNSTIIFIIFMPVLYKQVLLKYPILVYQ